MIIIVDNADTADVSDIARIETEAFSDPWTKEGIYAALWSDNSIFLAAREESGRAVGYIIGISDGSKGFIDNIAVDKNYRCNGIGRLLLDGFQLRLGEKAESITLEVRESNESAIRLYTAAGFKSEGIRKDFYSKPRENAIVMIKQIKRNEEI